MHAGHCDSSREASRFPARFADANGALSFVKVLTHAIMFSAISRICSWSISCTSITHSPRKGNTVMSWRLLPNSDNTLLTAKFQSLRSERSHCFISRASSSAISKSMDAPAPILATNTGGHTVSPCLPACRRSIVRALAPSLPEPIDAVFALVALHHPSEIWHAA